MHQIHQWDLSTKGQRHCQAFPLQVCIAKCNSCPALDSVLCQDLLLGEGQGVEGGDSLEVAYTGWLFQNNGLGQVKTCLSPLNAGWDSACRSSRVLVLMLKVYFGRLWHSKWVICIAYRILRDSGI